MERMSAFEEDLRRWQTNYLTEVLLHTNGNVKQAARLIEIPRSTLQTKLTELGLKGHFRLRQIVKEHEALMREYAELEVRLDSIERQSKLLEAETKMIKQQLRVADEEG